MGNNNQRDTVLLDNLFEPGGNFLLLANTHTRQQVGIRVNNKKRDALPDDHFKDLLLDLLPRSSPVVTYIERR
ncbi:hypothetical protein D3C81_2103670 [compost metagenome]